MVFGEKLLKLRKENGMSQEALAEKLNTSRQAISKWENGLGYPETEKLLMISNVFNVSVDYLLKDTREEEVESQKGYYVSKEMAEGFIRNESKMAKYISIGISLLIGTVIPYTLLSGGLAIIGIVLMVTVGIGFIVASDFKEENYKVIKREPLMFDEATLKELRNRYNNLKGKYIALSIVGVSFIVAGLTIIFLFEIGINLSGSREIYNCLCALMISIGVYILGYFSSLMEAYNVIVKNEEYVDKFTFRVLRKIREKGKEI